MKKKNAFRASRIALIVVCVILAIILALLLAAVIIVDGTLDLLNRPDPSLSTLSSSEVAEMETETEPGDIGNTAPTLDPEDVTWATEPAVTIGAQEDDHIINILLIGQDEPSGNGRARSDSMILCTVNTEKKTLIMTSFLRDLYVQIPGYQDTRLNAAFRYGGMELLNETLALNFGVQVDGNVEVNFAEFTRVIDLLGGVDINLTPAEAGVLNGAGHSVSAGVNHLDGAEALTYARIRKLDNDFGRTNRQRTVITALINQCRNSDIATLSKLLNEVLPMITTDLTNQEIVSYFVELVPLLKDIQISTQSIPAEGTFSYARIRGMAVLIPDLEANRQVLVETLLD